MSWFKKAEELLNRVDQSAAQVLHKNDNGSESFEPTHNRNSSTASYDNSIRFEPTPSGGSTPSGGRKLPKRLHEDELIEFLNSTEADNRQQRSKAPRKLEISKITRSQVTSDTSVIATSRSNSDSDSSFTGATRSVSDIRVNDNDADESIQSDSAAAVDEGMTEQTKPHLDTPNSEEQDQRPIEEQHQEAVEYVMDEENGDRPVLEVEHQRSENIDQLETTEKANVDQQEMSNKANVDQQETSNKANVDQQETSNNSRGEQQEVVNKPKVDQQDMIKKAKAEQQEIINKAKAEQLEMVSKMKEYRSRLNAVEKENKVLKREIEALNRECTSLIERDRSAQSDRDAQRSEMTKLRGTISAFERRIRELETELADSGEALRAKDTQVGVLKVRLDEAEREISEARNATESRRSESEAAARDFAQATAMKDSAIESLAAQVRELDAALKNERIAHETALHEAAELTRRVEAERDALAAQLNESSRRTSDEHFRSSELNRQLLVAKHASDALRDELEAYREKAQMLVSSKERTVAQLVALLQQHGITQIPATQNESMQRSVNANLPSPSSESGPASPGISLSGLLRSNLNLSSDDVVSVGEFEAVRNERDALKEELRAARCAIEQLRADLQDAEAQSDAERRSLQDSVASLEQQITVIRAHSSECEIEMRSAQRSAACAQDELHKQTLHFRGRLADREAEIERLRAQVLAQQRSPSSPDSNLSHFIASTSDGDDKPSEMLSRMRSLTENLIAKQTMVETLQTEKQTLRVQLERANERYLELQRQANANGNAIGNGNAHDRMTMPRSRGIADSMHTNVAFDDPVGSSGQVTSSVPTFDYDDVVRRRLPLPGFMRESLSRDTKLTRNVRKAVTSIDVFSIRLGLFLRRYPIARVFLLCYMFFLHFWVFVVLTTYQHEMHTSADLLYAPHNVEFNVHPQPNAVHQNPVHLDAEDVHH